MVTKIVPGLKILLPDRRIRMRIWFGPFRGGRVFMNPRNSQRKIFGLYERENNRWLEIALSRVSRVLDIGANDGYFTFGCAAAFSRLGVCGEVIAFEPDPAMADLLKANVPTQEGCGAAIQVITSAVGCDGSGGALALDDLEVRNRTNTLIKIDVEGAELDVIRGARSWMDASNYFLIEVHREKYVDELKSVFDRHRLKLIQVNQQPLPVLGFEERDASHCWLMSELGHDKPH